MDDILKEWANRLKVRYDELIDELETLDSRYEDFASQENLDLEDRVVRDVLRNAKDNRRRLKFALLERKMLIEQYSEYLT